MRSKKKKKPIIWKKVKAQRRAIIDQSQRNLNEFVARRFRGEASNLNQEAVRYDESVDNSSLLLQL